MKFLSKSKLAWLLLGVSAFSLAALALFSISREKQSNTQRRADLLNQQQQHLSEKLSTYFSEIQLQTARQLIALHQEGLDTQLERWAKSNPLIQSAAIIAPPADIQPYLDSPNAQLTALESPDTPSTLRSGYYQDNKEIALYEEGTIDPILFWTYQNEIPTPHWIVGHRIAKAQPLRIATLDTPALTNAFQNLLNEFAAPNITARITPSPAKNARELSTILPGYSLQLTLAPDSDQPWFSAFSYSFVILTLAIGILCSLLIARQAAAERRDILRKTTFVSQISHEFKTPLTSISLYAELLASDGLPSQKRQKYLDTISRESHRLSEMVDNILALNALEMGKKQYRIQTLDLSANIDSILSDYQPTLRSVNIHATWTPPSETVFVDFDPAALRQILLNLFDNTRKYAASGKVIRLSLETSAHCRLLIEDEGPGIPSDLRDQVFEAFYQEKSTLIDKSPGAGIGLSISRRMARDCQGDLSLDHNYTPGARFVLDLPRSNAS